MSPFVLEVREYLERHLSPDEIAHRMKRDLSFVLLAIQELRKRQIT